jgi:hypothetical protein
LFGLSLALGVVAGLLAVRIKRIGISIIGGISGTAIGLLICTSF